MDDEIPLTRALLKGVLEVALKKERIVLKEELDTTEKKLREYIGERTRDMQTELLRGFALIRKTSPSASLN